MPLENSQTASKKPEHYLTVSHTQYEQDTVSFPACKEMELNTVLSSYLNQQLTITEDRMGP